MSPSRAQERRDVSPLLIPLGVIAGAAALWFGLPGLVLIWLALAISGFMHPAPPRPKASEKDDPWVEESRLKHQFFRTMATTLIAPSKGWFSGWPPLYSFFGAILAAAAALHIPQFNHDAVVAGITEYAAPVAEASVWFPVLNAVAALLICFALTWARRKTMDSEETCPGTRVSDAVTVARSKPHAIIGPGVIGTVLGVMAAPALAENSDWPYFVIVAGALIGGVLLGTYPAARHQALSHWREVLAHRRDWRERFKSIKKEPAPRVEDVSHLGRDESKIMVLHLVSNAAVGGSEWFLKNPDKLAATVGGSTSIAVAPVEQKDSKGQPKPGTVDAISFDIIELPSVEAVPSLGSAQTDEKVTEQLLRAVFAQASAENAERFMPTGHETITTSEARVLKVSVSGIDVKTASQMLPKYSAAIGADVVADPSADNKAGALYMGHFEGAEFTEESGVTQESIQYLLKEDWWNQRWADAIKKAENPPKPEWRTELSAKLASGAEVHSLTFVIRRGMTPENDFFPFEREISTALESYPFVSMTGFDDPRASRPGERHRQAVTLRWSEQPVPDSIEDIAPVGRSKAPQWVMAAIVNRGFADAKLARPEMISVDPISQDTSRKHLWQMHVRLYNGVTLADVRKKRHQLMESWGADYLRVAETRNGVKFIAGVHPRDTQVRDRKAQTLLDALEWEQVFIDSGVKSESGTMPQLLSVHPVEENPKVKIMTFSLRNTGMALEGFVGRVPKLKANSGNAFVQPQASSSGRPNEIEIVVAEDDPMPFPATMDYREIDRRSDLPFAVDIYGRTVAYDPKDSPHLLYSGVTGGGKAQPVDTWIPVPISEKFPTGWAQNRELSVGDTVLSAAGGVSPVIGFSEERVETTYRLTIDDGQQIRASGQHLWDVADAQHRARATPERVVRSAAWSRRLLDAADDLEDKASAMPPEVGARLSDIARLAGYSKGSLGVLDFIPVALSRIALEKTSKTVRTLDFTGVKAQMRRIAERNGRITVAGRSMTPGEVDDLGFDGQWLCLRSISEVILGPETTRVQRDAVRSLLRNFNVSTGQGTERRAVRVYPVDEVLLRIAQRWRDRAAGHDHPVSTVKTTEQMYAELTAGGGRSNWAIPVPAPLDGPDADLPVPPYLLGAWLGDGISRAAGITLAPTDHTIIDRIVAEWGPVHRTEANTRSAATTYFFGKSERAEGAGERSLGVALSRLGVTHSQGGKHIPAQYLRASYDQRLALLQGLMDTDGSIGDDGNCALELSDERLARDAVELIRSLGIKTALGEPKPASYRADDGELVSCKDRYRIRFTTTQRVFELERKAARLPETIRPVNAWHYITDIQVEDEVPMRCLRLAKEDHSYLTDGFVATHNSVAIAMMIYGALVRGWEVYVADPSKGGTDFFFAEDYIAGMTGDLYEAAGMMRHVYQEVTRRKALNAEYKVSKVSDLPKDVRPRRLVMVLDEFTSLMMQEKPPERSDNPEASAAREEVVQLNAEKQTIGYLAGKIAREARSAEVTLILATQKLDSTVLGAIPGANDLKGMMARGLAGNATLADRQVALRSPYDAPDLGEPIPPGRGLWEPITAGKAEAIQAWFDPEQQDGYRKQLAQRLEPWLEEDRPDWRKQVRVVDDSPTVRQIDEEEAVVVEQDLGELDYEFDFDDEGPEG